jgi:hypothetical protein
MLEKIMLLIMCHMIGDYVLQSDFIAKTKGKNWYHLFVHCVLYIVPFYICFGFVWQLAVIFIAHLVIDPLKARYNKINYWQDQTLHYLASLLYLM